MIPISVPAAGSSYFSQAEGTPSPPHFSVGELVNWCSSELHSFFGTNNFRAPIVVSTQANSSNIPEPAHANDFQSHSEGFITFSTAIIPLSGRAVPTRVTSTLVPLPLHFGTGQYPSSLGLSSPGLDQGGEHSLFPPLQPPQLSEQSHLSEECSMTMGDITEDPRYSEYLPTPGGSPVVPRNPIPGLEVCYDYQPSRPVDPIHETIPDGTSAAVSTSPGVAVYPPPFNPTPGTCLVPGHPLSSSLVNRTVVPAPRTTCQNKRNRRSTSRHLTKAYQGTPTPLTAARPIRGVGVDQRHQCNKCNASYARPSGLNRHFKDKHSAWMTCNRCKSEFSWGRMYKFTEHLKTCPSA